MGKTETRTVAMRLGEETAEFELLWDKAPGICEALWSRLPLESFVTPAKVCSSEIIFMLPFMAEGENMVWPKTGDVGWWVKRSSVNIWYNDAGPLGPLGPTALFGKVTRNMEGIEREAKNIWARPGAKIVLTRKTASDTRVEDVATNSNDSQTVCSNVEALLKKEWMERTDEIKQLEGRTGAWNSNFGVHIHCQSETMEILEMVWPIRAAVKAGRLSLDEVKSFLGSTLIEKGNKMNRYYKITELPGVLNQVGAILPKLTVVDDFVKILDLLLLYVGRYNYWLDSDLDWKALSETHEKSRKNRGW